MTFEIMKGWRPRFSSRDFFGRSVSEIDRVISRCVRGRLVGIKLHDPYEGDSRMLSKLLEKIASQLGCSPSDVSAHSLYFTKSILYISLSLEAYKTLCRSDATKAWEISHRRVIAETERKKLLNDREHAMKKLDPRENTLVHVRLNYKGNMEAHVIGDFPNHTLIKLPKKFYISGAYYTSEWILDKNTYWLPKGKLTRVA